MRVEARRNEAMRGATRSSVLRGWPCARFPLSLSCSRLLPSREPCLSRARTPPTRSLLLSPFLSPRRRSRLKTRSKSRRRVASSRFGDSKEGSFLFPSLAVACLPGLPRFARSNSISHASACPPPALPRHRSRRSPRNQTRNVRSDFEKIALALALLSLRMRLFGSCATFSRRPVYLALSIRSSSSLERWRGVSQRAESGPYRFVPFRVHSGFSLANVRKNRIAAFDFRKLKVSMRSATRDSTR